MPGLTTPILSAIELAKCGVALHVEEGNTYADFKNLGGSRLYLRDDCMIKIKSIKANAATCRKAHSGKRAPRRRSPSKLNQAGNGAPRK